MLYHVALQDKNRNALFTTKVEASSENEAIRKARAMKAVPNHIAIYAEAISAFDEEVYYDA